MWLCFLPFALLSAFTLFAIGPWPDALGPMPLALFLPVAVLPFWLFPFLLFSLFIFICFLFF
jgi:hypothetical protein